MMIKITLSKEIDGEQLAQELQITNEQLKVEEGFLIIDAKIDTNFAENVLKNHKPKPYVNHRANALAKLAALGLTENEIAAL